MTAPFPRIAEWAHRKRICVLGMVAWQHLKTAAKKFRRNMHSQKPSARPKSVLVSLSAALVLLGPFALAEESAKEPSHSAPAELTLRDGWSLQSSAKVEQKGEVISTSNFVPKGWYDVSVPTTVVAALVKNKTLPDPFFGMNLREFPGERYPIGGNFSL